MFSSTPSLSPIFSPRLAKVGKNAASALAASRLAPVDEAPPVRRLTAGEIHLISLKWKAKGRAGDENAMRVAEALEWVARRRASEKKPKPLNVLARRLCAWMGSNRFART